MVGSRECGSRRGVFVVFSFVLVMGTVVGYVVYVGSGMCFGLESFILRM